MAPPEDHDPASAASDPRGPLQPLLALLDPLPFPCMLVAQDGAVLGVNRATMAERGVARAEWVGRSFRDVAQGLGAPELGFPLESALRTGARGARGEVCETESGRMHFVEVHQVDDVEVGGKRVYLHFSRDVTGEKTAAAELSQALEQNRALSSLLSDLSRCSTRVAMLEALTDRLLSLSWLSLSPCAAAFLVDDDGLVRVVERNLAQEIRGCCARVARGHCLCGRAAETGEILVSTCVDEAHSVSFAGMGDHGHVILPLSYDGTVEGVLALYLPPHQAPQGEPLIFLRAVAAAGGAALFGQRVREQVALAERTRLIGQLATGLAHDLNNLLCILGVNAELLADQVAADPASAACVAEMQAALRSSERLVGQVLTFARREIATPRVIELNTDVQALAAMFRRVLGSRVELVVSTTEEPLNVRIDPSGFEQVLANLLVNARDALPDGAGRLVVETSRVRGVGEASANDGSRTWASVVVRDNGCGIPPTMVGRVFEPFFTTKPTGTGIGLATTARVVREAGGSIRCHSEKDVGTLFEILLPLHFADCVDEPNPPVDVKPGAGRRVVVVDDEAVVRSVLRRILEAADYRVVEAGSGAEALRHLSDGEPVHVVLTDVTMPEMSGTALDRRIRALGLAVPIVFMSGRATVSGPSETEDGAPHETVRKPFTRNEVLTALHRAIHGSGRTGE